MAASFVWNSPFPLYNYGLIAAAWENKSASSENIAGLGIYLQHMERRGSCHCSEILGRVGAGTVGFKEGLQRFSVS